MTATRTWRDPLHHLRHEVYRLLESRASQRVVGYETGCGIKLTVDDLNASNVTSDGPTCLACIVEVPVIPEGG